MKKKVFFESEGKTLAGDLYFPEGYVEGQKLPAVVVTGAWTTVKEQMSATYAKELAVRGFLAMTFDFRGWGESTDEPRYLEDPVRKTADINAAVNFLAQQAEVDTVRIGGLGICASSGYMSDAALANTNIKAIALVAPWLHDAEIVEVAYGGSETVSALIEVGEQAASSKDPVYLEAASTENENAVMYQAPYYTETGRGLIPEYDNKFNAASWKPWLTFDAIKTANSLRKPTLMVHSEAAAIPEGAKKYQSLMGDSAQTIWIDDVTQFDFYDKPEIVTASADAVAQHFNQQLV